MIKQGKLFIVSAPSGAGKTSLVTMVIERLGLACSLERVVTYTTKQPRVGDVQGKDYHFISEADFKKKIEHGFFIEWSTAYGNYYGSPLSIIEGMAQGLSYIVVVDRLGARKMYSQITDAILLWIYTKSVTVLKERLAARATEDVQQMNYRLFLALQELEEEASEQLYHHHILNDDFAKALQELESVVVSALKTSL